MSKDTMLIVHGGAPTAVINASLYGAIEEMRASGAARKILGAHGGLNAILTGDFIDLSALSTETMDKLPFTPASFIGTSRYPIRDEKYDTVVDRLVESGIGYLLFNGGNGSMEACWKIARAAGKRKDSAHIRIMGIPKTMDNDIAVTDHAPGFGSAARYLATSVRELAFDLASLPIHVCILESMGRNSGWLTAASALAADTSPGPHLVYVPEMLFDETAFLDKAKALFDHFGGIVVVASEGLKGLDGHALVPPIFQVGRSVYYGDVSAHLCNLVIRKLGIKARSEKPGILGRCSSAHQSSVDREEAIEAAREAVKSALAGKSGMMVGFRRLADDPYRCETMLIPLEDVMMVEKTLPPSCLTTEGHGISTAYLNWCRPLLGGALPDFAVR